MTDRLWRICFRLGYRAARLWWRVRRPGHDGAVIAIWFDGRILGVRQSYKSTLTWPGGGIARGEDEKAAAQRELREELGLAVHLDDLVLVRREIVDWDYRRDHVRIFEMHLDAAPRLRVDNREIIDARFMRPEAMLAAAIPPFIRSYLLERRSFNPVSDCAATDR